MLTEEQKNTIITKVLGSGTVRIRRAVVRPTLEELYQIIEETENVCRSDSYRNAERLRDYCSGVGTKHPNDS